MSEVPDANDLATICERIRDAMPTAEEMAEHMRYVGAVVGKSLEETLAGAEGFRLTHDRR